MALTKSEKMDKAGARTPADIERKYNFGKSFSEVIGVANDSRRIAEETQREVEDMFVGDIHMSGKMFNTAEMYFDPEIQEYNQLLQHLDGTNVIPDLVLERFDFNGDGVVDSADSTLLIAFLEGKATLDNFKKIPTNFEVIVDFSNPNNTFSVSGFNMWGRKLEFYSGLNIYSNYRPVYQSHYMAKTGEGASYQVIVDNWSALPNWSAWGCSVQGHIMPYLGGAFGYRVDHFGYFIYFDYSTPSAKFVQIRNDAVVSIRDV